ncbi:MAG: hypothetical protein ACKO66_01305, partial [Flavobacteriales bacterium]
MKHLLTCLCILSASVFHAQSWTISGTITDASSGETMPGVIIYSPDFKIGSASNAFGFYSVTIPEVHAPMRVVYQMVGYIPIDTLFERMPKSLTDVVMCRDSSTMKALVIESDKAVKTSDESRMSTLDISVADIRKIPALLGEKDVLKVLQLLPG